jgi:uncharacterized membrane protein
MNSIQILIGVLLVLLLVVGGRRGWQIFLGLLFNFVTLLILIILLNWQFNPVIVTAIIGVVLLAFAIYLGVENMAVGHIAFGVSVSVFIVLMGLAGVVEHFGQFGGFAAENADELEGLSLNIGLSFSTISFVVMSIATLGAVAEAAMAISADLNEVIERESPTLSELKTQAQIIGGQILGTAINTLFFGVLGASLTLIVWYVRLSYSWAEFFNSKMLLAEVATMLLGMLGILLAIWLATQWILFQYQKNGKTL